MDRVTLENDDSLTVKLNKTDIDLEASEIIDEKTIISSKRRILKNLIILCISFLFQFSAANGLSNLQSSLNSADNLGVTSMLTGSISFTAICLILPNILLKYVGYKWSLVLCEIIIIIYVIANFKATFYTLIPASVLFGMAMGIMWTFQGSLIAFLATEYSKYSKKKVDSILVKFFGIFMFIFQINQITGNTISALILRLKIFNNQLSDNMTESIVQNQTFQMICGCEDCPGPINVIPRPNDKIVYLLCSSYLVLAIIGLLCLILFFDNFKHAKYTISIKETIIETFKIFTSLRKILIIPLILFASSFNVFIFVDLSKSFVACAYGMHTIGYWFLIWGTSSSLFSLVTGIITKKIKTTFMLLFYILSASLCVCYLLFWDKNSHILIIYILAILCGALENIWGTCLNTLLGVVFHDRQSSAFSANRFCLSLAFMIGFAYSELLCVKYKIYIVLSFGILSFICIIILEITLNNRKKNRNLN